MEKEGGGEGGGRREGGGEGGGRREGGGGGRYEKGSGEEKNRKCR